MFTETKNKNILNILTILPTMLAGFLIIIINLQDSYIYTYIVKNPHQFITYFLIFLIFIYISWNFLNKPKSYDDNGLFNLTENRIRELHKKIDNISEIGDESKEEIKDSISKMIGEKITEDIHSDLLDKLKNEYSDKVFKETKIERHNITLNNITSRLNSEIDSLGRRNIVNLLIGIITTGIAIGVLSMSVIDVDTKIAKDYLLSYYAPRVTLSIFIQIFSFFFLRLYKTGLSEIKYFQNELTNVQSKALALECAVLAGNENYIKDILTRLASTERNFVLNKGQSTVDLEKQKIENSENSNIASSVIEVVKALNGIKK